jgi:HK97 family phage major capsid protein
MSKLNELRALRDTLSKEANELNASAPSDQPLSKEAGEKLDAVMAKIELCDADINRQKRTTQLLGEKNDHEDVLNQNVKASNATKAGDGSALRAYLKGGLRALSDEQMSALRTHQTPEIQAAMSTTTDTEGGYTTSPEYNTRLEEVMKAFGGMRSVANVIRTATGNVMYFVTTDATAEEGEIVGQNQSATLGETSFGQVNMGVYKYSSKYIALPWELLQDTFLDLEGYINGLLGTRLARIGNKHFTVGTGTDQPKGIVPSVTVGKTGAAGQLTGVIYDDLVDMEHSVDPAYRGAGTWMFSDKLLADVRKIKDTNGRPVFVPGYETGSPGGAPDRLLGRTFTINQDMPEPAAGKRSLLFGDFRKYLIRDVMDTTFFRMTDSAFTLKGQVGFVAFRRMGGALIDVGGAVKAFAHAAR